MSPRLPLAALFASALFTSASLAQDKPADDALRDKWKQAYQKIAESIEMHGGDAVLKMHDRPLLFYTNPVVDTDQHGAIFLWTKDGRPAILGSIWSARNRSDEESRFVAHEWHSLSDEVDLTATRAGQLLWKAGEPGITWLTLADVPRPAPSRANRLVQMRSLARRLSARAEGERNTELRLMTQPLHRYHENTAGALDGAIFACALATDPELLLWIEAAGERGTESWRVAIARFGILPMTVKDGEKTIWSCPEGKGMVREGKYCVIWRAELMPASP